MIIYFWYNQVADTALQGEQDMRVISGLARGHALSAPKGEATRPTADRMKEDIFNIITPLLSGAYFLDLYSGSGSIGIEALSRGADSAVFVDISAEAVSVIKTNLRKTRFEAKAEILHMSTANALKQLAAKNKKFSIIFMDPPYESRELFENLTFSGELLESNGIIIVECPTGKSLPFFPNLTIYREKKYTRTNFIFFERGDSVDSHISGKF